jgi:hypothetical protein
MGTKIKPKNIEALKADMPEKDFKIFTETSNRVLGEFKVLKQGLDIEAFEEWMERPRTEEEADEERGYRGYSFMRNGKEYFVYLFEGDKGVISYFDEEYNSVYIGACLKGKQSDMILFAKPLHDDDEKGIDFSDEAEKLALKLLK